MIIEEEEHLAHYGILRRSGRYPWGSGGSQLTRNKTFLSMVDDLKKEGLTESEICTAFGIGTTDSSGKFRPSTTQLRAAKSIAKAEVKQANILMAQRLSDKGLSNGAIAERMGLAGESSVRALLAPGAADKADALMSTADMLKRQVDEKGFLDVGVGVEHYVGVSKERLNTAVSILKEQGYVTHTVPVRQLGTGHETRVKVLAPPGTTWGDVRKNQGEIKQIREFSNDGGRTYSGFKPPLSVNPKRVDVVYAEDGGSKADGVIYVRRGVDDLSLGAKSYAQVRIQVGDGHYLKGMAIYKDDLPKGVDLQFNTNKSSTGNKLDVMKPLKDDPDLPFGSVVRQILDRPGHPDAKPTSAMNLVNEEGDWNNWSRNLSSQMLSKQQPSLAKEQLRITSEKRKQDLAEIKALTNVTVKRKLLEAYADSTDAASVHLKAAHLPRQASQVILPLNSIKPSEVFAPGYNNGERVVLIRYPHGGKFEIPELVVNNRNQEGVKLIGKDALDAIGIHHTVAQRLSGADFDGDTVLVIPNNSGKVKTSPALEGLKGFDPQVYKIPDGSPIPRITPDRMQKEMGRVSNLITDMTIRGASHDELARAVRHSMVVIDSEKHGLNVKQSAVDNGISNLKERYQGSATGGASTLISRAGSPARVNERKLRPQSEGGPVDKDTGKLVYVETGRVGVNGSRRQTKLEKLALADDAYDLVSDARTPIEKIYADHSNTLKALANDARLTAINTPRLRYSPSAKQTYSKEVESLNAKLLLASMNAPRERQAQIIANARVRAKREADPHMEESTRKKLEYQELEDARAQMGASKKERLIEITQDEWNAIQAGAITDNMLGQILTNADLDAVKALATPRLKPTMSGAATARARSMLSNGATRAEVAAQLGVSVSTLDSALSESSK